MPPEMEKEESWTLIAIIFKKIFSGKKKRKDILSICIGKQCQIYEEFFLKEKGEQGIFSNYVNRNDAKGCSHQNENEENMEPK